jgi:hypothetical protein
MAFLVTCGIREAWAFVRSNAPEFVDNCRDTSVNVHANHRVTPKIHTPAARSAGPPFRAIPF